MVKNLKSKIYEKRESLKEFAASNKTIQAGQNALISAGFLALTPLSTYALATVANPGEMINKLISVVCDIFRMIGAILLVWAIGQLVLAFKNEDADSKSRAMLVLVCSILLLSLKTLYTAVTGVDVGDSGLGL